MDEMTSLRRPSREEATILILQLAARIERQALRVSKAAIIDDHQKAGLADYLKREAANLRVLAAGSAMIKDGAVDGLES